MVEIVKLTDRGLRIYAEMINGYNYTYGVTTPIYYRTDITKEMEGRTKDEALFIADMMYCVSLKGIKATGRPAEQSDDEHPLEGCSMLCFYEPGRGRESARVVLQHPLHEVIAYERDIHRAIAKANEVMKKLLKR